MQRLLGAVTLGLIFFAGAGFTVAYLSNAAINANIAQTAAVAAVVPNPFADIKLLAESAYVLDLTTNRVLYSQNPDAQLPLASLVKVPLALVASEVLLPEFIITIPQHETPDGAFARLPAGLRFSTQNLIDFTLVASSNEGAGIIEDTARAGIKRKYPEADQNKPVLWRMNDLARNLGLVHTYFLNSSGLDLSMTQASAYGSARDVAFLFMYAASTSPALFGQTSRNNLTIRAISGETVRASNTDDALPSIPGLIMGKTGYTDLAGGNLAVVFEVGPTHRVVAVVLHSTYQGRFEDMRKLAEATIASISQTSPP